MWFFRSNYTKMWFRQIFELRRLRILPNYRYIILSLQAFNLQNTDLNIIKNLKEKNPVQLMGQAMKRINTPIK